MIGKNGCEESITHVNEGSMVKVSTLYANIKNN